MYVVFWVKKARGADEFQVPFHYRKKKFLKTKAGKNTCYLHRSTSEFPPPWWGISEIKQERRVALAVSVLKEMKKMGEDNGKLRKSV